MRRYADFATIGADRGTDPGRRFTRATYATRQPSAYCAVRRCVGRGQASMRVAAAAACACAGVAPRCDGNRAGDKPRHRAVSRRRSLAHGGFCMAACCGRRRLDARASRSSCLAAAFIITSSARSATSRSDGSCARPPYCRAGASIRDGIIVTVFLGFDFQQHNLKPDDPIRGLRGSYVGAAYRHRALVSTDRNDDDRGRRIVVHHRAELQCAPRAGLRVFDGSSSALRCGASRGRQLPPVPRRPSCHRLQDRRFEWSAGAGWATDTDDRSGAYGKLGCIRRRR